MSRELEAYRDNFEALKEYFGGKMLLTAKEVGEYCGIDFRTAQRRFGITRDGITIPTLARRMAR